MSELPERIAVLVPVLNEADRIGALLGLLCAMDFAEIIIADGGSTDGTQRIVQTFAVARLINCERGRGTQIAAAARAATCPLIVIVHADTVLPPDAPRLIRDTLNSTGVAAGCFRLRFEPTTPMLVVYGWFTRFDTSLTTFGDQCFFMRRDTYKVAGGAPSWPLLEDVELRRRLLSHGRFVKRPEVALTSARRFKNTALSPNNFAICSCSLATPAVSLSPRWPGSTTHRRPSAASPAAGGGSDGLRERQRRSAAAKDAIVLRDVADKLEMRGKP